MNRAYLNEEEVPGRTCNFRVKYLSKFNLSMLSVDL